MNTGREEIRELVSVFERIHKALQDDQFSGDDKEFIVMCATELIDSMSSQNHRASGGHLRMVP